MEYLLTGAEMADCDRRTSEVIGIPSLVLMERAALSVADGVDAWLQTSGNRQPVILAAAGRGNNGADALAAGRILLERGYEVHFCRLSGEVSPESSFAVQEKILRSFGREVVPFDCCPWLSGIASGKQTSPESGKPDVIIDGLFGTGLSRPLQGEAALCVEAINRCRSLLGSYVVAVDIPSGISSEDGSVMGCAVRCDETRTFAFYKRGHFLYPGASYAGRCHLAQIGITERAFSTKPGMFTFLHETVPELVPARDPGGNKGTFGKVLLISGRKNMCGAALLSARACFAAGAGMVRIFTHEANRTIIQQSLPEAMLDTFTESESGEMIAAKLGRAIAWADTAAAGPAMGTDSPGRILLKALLQEAGCTESSGRGGCANRLRGLVLDADALRLLAAEPELQKMLAGRREDLPCILSPHLAEFAALAGKSVRDCLGKRAVLVQEQALKFRCTIACKDARTLVTSADAASGLYLNCSGNSGMATAGSGDVLTGMTAAILAGSAGLEGTGLFSREDISSGFAAACCAVYLHGKAGDRACRKHGEQGMTAGDLVSALREASFWR